MSENAQFEGYAIVEIVGRQTHIGYVTTRYFGNVAVFEIRIDRHPEETLEPDILRVTEHGAFYPGDRVTFAETKDQSVYVGTGSLYRLTPISQEMARNLTRWNRTVIGVTRKNLLTDDAGTDALTIDAEEL